jgi:hypothetical protein
MQKSIFVTKNKKFLGNFLYLIMNEKMGSLFAVVATDGDKITRFGFPLFSILFLPPLGYLATAPLLFHNTWSPKTL